MPRWQACSSAALAGDTMRIALPGTRGAGRAGFRLGCVVAALRVFLPCGFMRTRISLVIRRKREVRVYTRQIARRGDGYGGRPGMFAKHKRQRVHGGPPPRRPELQG